MAVCESECLGHCISEKMQAEADKDNPTGRGFITKFKKDIYDCLACPNSLAGFSGKQQKDCPGFGEKVLVGTSRYR